MAGGGRGHPGGSSFLCEVEDCYLLRERGKCGFRALREDVIWNKRLGEWEGKFTRVSWKGGLVEVKAQSLEGRKYC